MLVMRKRTASRHGVPLLALEPLRQRQKEIRETHLLDSTIVVILLAGMHPLQGMPADKDDMLQEAAHLVLANFGVEFRHKLGEGCAPHEYAVVLACVLREDVVDLFHIEHAPPAALCQRRQRALLLDGTRVLVTLLLVGDALLPICLDLGSRAFAPHPLCRHLGRPPLRLLFFGAGLLLLPLWVRDLQRLPDVTREASNHALHHDLTQALHLRPGLLLRFSEAALADLVGLFQFCAAAPPGHGRPH
mmetsp:Transcript_38079/g.80963  ORF Transcript_38079/g.80963 Transcript_38079/m.80963 type:complete len:246 (+) Transcript_38079:516-1253(+)